MVDVCPQSEPELSTESTPSTIETTVEASGTLSSKGELGGRGGKEGAALNPAWARALHSAASCQLGRCAYADPTKRPNRSVGAQGCDGYHATEHLDADGVVTVRWFLCVRHREWWRLERIRLQAAKMPKPVPHPGIGPER